MDYLMIWLMYQTNWMLLLTVINIYFERMIHYISYLLSLCFAIIKSVRSLQIEGDVLIDKRNIVEGTVILDLRCINNHHFKNDIKA